MKAAMMLLTLNSNSDTEQQRQQMHNLPDKRQPLRNGVVMKSVMLQTTAGRQRLTTARLTGSQLSYR